MQTCELTVAITAVSNALGNQLTTRELSLLAVIFTQLGDTLATIAAQRSFCEAEKK